MIISRVKLRGPLKKTSYAAQKLSLNSRAWASKTDALNGGRDDRSLVNCELPPNECLERLCDDVNLRRDLITESNAITQQADHLKAICPYSV